MASRLNNTTCGTHRKVARDLSADRKTGIDAEFCVYKPVAAFLRVMLVIACTFPLFAIALTEIHLKTTFETNKASVCLSELVEMSAVPPRAAEKLRQYCRIELKGARLTLTAKDIELHAWAAGVIPDKITGGPVIISKATSMQLPKAESTATPARIRRGTAVQLVIKSEHMQIAREAAVLSDAFPGETVDVRPHGTRKTLKAKLITQSVAELIP